MSLEFKVQGLDKFVRHTEKARLDLKSRQKIWAPIGHMLIRFTQQNFRKQQDPVTGAKWKRLKPRTLARRRGGAFGAKILQDTGQLKQSIAGAKPKVTSDSVSIGTNKIYAATHQYGDKRRKIPKRPYIGLGTKHKKEISKFVAQVLVKEFKK